MMEAATVVERRYVEMLAGPRAPAMARAEVLRALAGRDLDTVATAALVVSELVSNAVRHASLIGDSVGMALLIDRHRIRIEVTDAGAGFDRDAGSAHDGYGLRIVEDVADSWGVTGGPPHRVWCELSD